jgi:membrane fusion protein, multidrug efflux system
MKQYVTISLLATILLAACGESKKEGAALLNEKKAALEKLKNEKSKSDEAIKKLEGELATLDTTAIASKVLLVSVTPVQVNNFEHYIDLQGKIGADNISYISPRGMGGQVKELYIKEGDMVHKGQSILKLDDAIIRQQIATSKEQVNAIKTQLNFAKNIYGRQKNLWDQGIGTEVQLISAKNTVESLENQIKSAEEGIKIQQEQLKTTTVLSDVAGIADVVNIKVGELFSGMGAFGPQIKIVNTSSLKVTTNVPENYGGRIKKGSRVNVVIPDLNKNFASTISLISQSVDITQRGFTAEAKVPYDANLKPNQLAVIKILDYAAVNAVVIPINVVQTDEKGKYVFVMEKLSNGKYIAKKKLIVIGEVYGPTVEVKAGLQAAEQLITEGYQNLYEGQFISAANATL